jgi:hypothetical protein
MHHDPSDAARLVLGGDQPLDREEAQAHDNRQLPDVDVLWRGIGWACAAVALTIGIGWAIRWALTAAGVMG